MYTVFGKAFKFGDRKLPASHDDFEFGRTFFNLTEKLLAEVSERATFMVLSSIST
jgi:hypothetical protein